MVVRARAFAGAIVCAIAFVLVGSAAASAQSRAGALVLGIEVPLLRYERLTLEPVDSYEFDYSADAARTLTSFGFGLATDAHAALPLDAQQLVAAQVGYVLADVVLLGAHLGVGYGSLAERGSSLARWSFGFGPRVEYLFARDWIRPFAGLEGSLVAGKTSSDDHRVDDSDFLVGGGPTAGAYFFVGPAVALDARATFSYSAGTHSESNIVVTTDVMSGMLEAITYGVTETDVERLEAVLAVGISAWLR